MFAAKDRLDPTWRRWVRAHWIGAPFTTSQLRLATDLVVSHQQFSFHGKLVGYGGAVAALLQRAYSLQKRIDLASGAERQHLEGALSAIGFMTAVVDRGALVYIPQAGTYVGSGDPADSIPHFQLP